MGILAVAAGAMVVVRAVRWRDGRRICQEKVGGWAGESLMRLLGVSMKVHGTLPELSGPCFYMANHSSSLDLPILMALRLPDARTFLKERFRLYGPLGMVGMLTGTLYTAPQQQHARRVERFKRAEAILRRSGCSAFGSPEGTRVTGPEIGPFNRGVFHIVTNLKMPIVPILILIPQDSDPGRSISVQSAGEVHVHIGTPIDTSNWKEEELDTNKDMVREHFVAWNKVLREQPALPKEGSHTPTKGIE
jgi:putative phosphoserine phosphatase/1-acylglycerol-3-phosphate O-acyltransferase